MTCDSCVKSVSESLYRLDGITKVDANLKDQLVAVEGTGEFECAFETSLHNVEALWYDGLTRVLHHDSCTIRDCECH